MKDQIKEFLNSIDFTQTISIEGISIYTLIEHLYSLGWTDTYSDNLDTTGWDVKYVIYMSDPNLNQYLISGSVFSSDSIKIEKYETSNNLKL